MALALISGIGGGELLIIMVIFLLLFGSKKLPGIARTLGKTMAELQRAAREVREEFLNADRELNSPPPISSTDSGTGGGAEWQPDLEAYGYEPPTGTEGLIADDGERVMAGSETMESAMPGAPSDTASVATVSEPSAGSKLSEQGPEPMGSAGETRSI